MIKKIKILLKIFILLIILNLSASIIYYQYVVRFLKNHEISGVYDTGIIFFHDFDEKNKLSSITRERLNHSFELYEKKIIRNIILAGGTRLEKNLYGAKLMRKYSLNAGIPGSKIYYDSLSFDSFSNWEEAKKIIHLKDWNEILIISSPMHLFRLSKICKDETKNILFSTYLNDYINNYSYYHIWKDIQYEFVAWVAFWLLPEKHYKKLIKRKRKN